MSKRSWGWFGGALVVLVPIAVVAGWWLGGDRSEATEVVLVVAEEPGEDAFVPNAPDAELATDAELAEARSVEVSAADNVTDAASSTVYAELPDDACRVDEVIESLTIDRDAGEAFAETLGLGADELGSYLSGLRPVLLLVDTLVTNHRFSGGEVVAFQAVLQAGTPVLIDESGVAQVRCPGVNPLLEAEVGDEIDYVGTAWPSFDENRVAIVVELEPGEQVTVTRVAPTTTTTT
ncbi:MAG: DUF6777 domain-containing protein, partial [Actinomycetota bacterium]